MNNITALVQIIAWCRAGNKPLSETMVVNLPTHICVTWPQWVNSASFIEMYWSLRQDSYHPRRHWRMTSWHGNIFHITGPLWGESTCHWWIPLTKGPIMHRVYVFFLVSLNKILNKHSSCQWQWWLMMLMLLLLMMMIMKMTAMMMMMMTSPVKTAQGT